MAAVLSETELAAYCLKKLGAPVIRINVDDTQISDRISEALEYFQTFHDEGSERTYISHKITGSHLQLTTNVAQTFTIGETVTGSISGATFKLLDAPEINKIRAHKFTGTFIVGETVTGSISGATSTIAADGIYLGNIQNKTIPLPDEVLSVIRVLPIGTGKNSSNYMFDATYQFMANTVFNYQATDLSYYTNMQQYLSTMDYTLNKQISTQFSRITGNLVFVDGFWDTIEADQYILLEAYVSVVNGVNTKVYDNFWVKKYATVLIKRQWGENLKKYGNVVLPGGITLNGKEIYEEAITEKTELETLLKDAFSAPLGMMIG